MTQEPLIIGLAGGIGSGKTAAGRVLEELGCVVVCADEIVHHLLQHDEPVRRQLREWWGDDVLDSDGSLDRAAIARIVFSDVDQRERLEALLHPLVRKHTAAIWYDLTERKDDRHSTPALVIDAPLLFEVGLNNACDAVIFVDAPPSTRLARVRQRGAWSAEELDQREKQQMPLDIKRKQSDHVVQNDGDLSDLKKKIEAVLARILDDGPREGRVPLGHSL